MKQIKKYIFLAITLFISLIFLSCGQYVSSSNKDEVTHLTLWQGINPPPNRDVFNKLVDKFNKNHADIFVESIYAGQLDQQLPKILTAIIGNTPPDILTFNAQMTGQLIELDAIKSLDNWWENLPIKSDISANLLEEMKLDNHIWSIPLYTSNMGIFYRPKLFKEAGITETPKTWEELREVARKLTIDKNGDNRPEQYGMLLPLGKGEWTVFSWFPFLFSEGGEVVANNKPNLDNPKALAALEYWHDLIKDGSALLSAPERGYEEDRFIEGKIAMQITGPWTFIMKSDVDYAVFPIPKSATPATVIGGGNMYIMKTNPEREKAAQKFLEFVLSEEFQTEWSIGSGFLPVNIKSTQSQAYQNFVSQKPDLKVFLDQIPVARARPIIAGYTRLSDSLGRAIEATLMGESPKKALKAAQERLELIWDK